MASHRADLDSGPAMVLDSWADALPGGFSVPVLSCGVSERRYCHAARPKW